MQNTNDGRRVTSDGFTLVELLVALVVSSLILTTVATLAFALSRQMTLRMIQAASRRRCVLLL